MIRHSLFNAVAVASLLLASCASNASVAQVENTPNTVDLEDTSTRASIERTVSALPYKILGMPDEIDGESVFLNWPGSGVAVAFEGSQLLATIDGNSDTYLDIRINDVMKTVRLNDGLFTYRLIDAMPGTYDVSLQIRTDRAYRPIQFRGFVTDDGAISTPARSDLQMLVIGDDVAAGYGVEGEDQYCNYSRETQNANLSFSNVARKDYSRPLPSTHENGRISTVSKRPAFAYGSSAAQA